MYHFCIYLLLLFSSVFVNILHIFRSGDFRHHWEHMFSTCYMTIFDFIKNDCYNLYRRVRILSLPIQTSRIFSWEKEISCKFKQHVVKIGDSPNTNFHFFNSKPIFPMVTKITRCFGNDKYPRYEIFRIT